MAQHTSSLLPSVDGVIPAPINWRTDMEQGFLVTGRRCVRVPSNIPGPFAPNGQRQIVITTQSLSDELMDTSTLRLKFDYRATYNTTGAFPNTENSAHPDDLKFGTTGLFQNWWCSDIAYTGNVWSANPSGLVLEPGHTLYPYYGYPYDSTQGGPVTYIHVVVGYSYIGPINGYGGCNMTSPNVSVSSGDPGVFQWHSGTLPFYNILDDGGLSWVRTITVSIGNQVVETIDKYNILCNWLVYNTSKRDWLFSQGVSAGYWLDYMATTPSQTGTGGPFCNVSSDGSQQLIATALSGGNLANKILPETGIVYSYGRVAMYADIPGPARNCAGGMTLVCPLFLLAITRTRKLQAFKYWRGLQLTIDLEDWERCHTICDAVPNNSTPGQGLVGYPCWNTLQPGVPCSDYTSPVYIVASPGYTVASANSNMLASSGVTCNPSYQISNVYLLYDLVAPSADFAAQLEKLALSEGTGMAFKYDAWSTQTTQRTGLIQNSTITFTNSVSYTKVKSLFAIFRDAAVTAIPAQPFKTNTFIFPGLINYQWQVGSRRFPDYQTGDSTGWPVATGNTGTSMDTIFGNPSMAWRSGLTETYAYLQDALNQSNSESAGGVVNIGNYWRSVPFQNVMNQPQDCSPWAYQVTSTNSGGSPVASGTICNVGTFGLQFFQYLPPRFCIGLNMQVLNDAMLGADLRSTAPNTQLSITLGGDPGSTTQATLWASKVLEYILIVWYDMYLTIRGGVVGISK